MTERVRLAVAGAGAFGREHIRFLSTMADAEVVGIADVNAAAAETTARQAGVATTGTDAEALIDRVRPDGLIVATPGPTHVTLARYALAAGIPVLVEKPVAMTAAEASVLVEAEKHSSGGFIVPGHVLRFSESHRRMVDIARSTEVGPILSVTARRHRDDSHAVRYTEDPVLMTMIHDIDLALWISGASPQTVLAYRRPSGTSRSITLATMSKDAGPVWQLETAWTFPTKASPPDRIEVIGERGSVELQADGILNLYGDKVRLINVPTDLDEALRNEHAYFVACIRSHTKPTVVTLADAVAGLAVADAVRGSLATAGVVAV